MQWILLLKNNFDEKESQLGLPFLPYPSRDPSHPYLPTHERLGFSLISTNELLLRFFF
jgi:hypothetical protein